MILERGGLWHPLRPFGAAVADPAATADTLRKLRKLVIFSGEDLTENFPLYFNSVSLLEELEARVEDARLYMQGQERTAKTSGERQWLARGVSPERALEMRAARATTWAEFSQEEVDAMTPSKRHAMTTRFATQAAAAAKAKATAEAEEINVDHSIRPFVHEKWPLNLVFQNSCSASSEK